MTTKKLLKTISIPIVFLLMYFIPFEKSGIENPFMEAIYMLQDYARHHILFSLIPAFFIAGSISVFMSKQGIIKFLGAKANKFVSYTIASVSGIMLAVCSCTIIPIFGGIYKRGAGLGPAIAFLYAGPAINLLAIILTARVLGWELGVARMIGAISFSVVIGGIMALIFKKEEAKRHAEGEFSMGVEEKKKRPGIVVALFFVAITLVMLFASLSDNEGVKIWNVLYGVKWIVAGISLFMVLFITFKWFEKRERKDWMSETWRLMDDMLPLLFWGILAAGLLMGRPGHEGLIPSSWVAASVGGNSIQSNLLASVLGGLMYFCTLVEVPILEGLIGNGMGKGPALALLLAGPAISLPHMLVIKSILGVKKTVVYVILVVIMATITGIIYGNL